MKVNADKFNTIATLAAGSRRHDGHRRWVTWWFERWHTLMSEGMRSGR